MKKVLLTATVQSHICQFHKPLVAMLHNHGYEVHVAARNNLAEKNGLSIDFVDKVFDVPFARSPKSPDNLKAYKQLKRIISNGDYEVIHCNTPMGGIVTRLAAKKARKKGTAVFYTAHGFHFYEGAPLKNWLVFYPIEKIMAKFCDAVITIAEEDYLLAKDKFPARVERIHGVGVYQDRYYPVSKESMSSMRKKAGLKDEDFVVLCVGELNKNKNQKTLIQAARKLKKDIPNLKILLAGNGPLDEKLHQLVYDMGVTDIVYFLGYRRDLENITPMVDLIVSCSYREGLGLNVIEGMMCKKPVVASYNRGHKELVKNNFNGFTISPADNVQELADKVLFMFRHQSEALKMGENGFEFASQYASTAVYDELERIYGMS